MLILTALSVSAADGEVCSGYRTLLYAGDARVLYLCHGGNSGVSPEGLDDWQACGDALLYLREKADAETWVLADCAPGTGKQLRLSGDVVSVRHFYRQYPGFEYRPLMQERYDLGSGARGYAMEARFEACPDPAVEKAVATINDERAKPFDGSSYFRTVYGGLFTLRDCAATTPRRVLAILQRYREEGHFDGEVAETLSEIIDEVKLLVAAAAEEAVKR